MRLCFQCRKKSADGLPPSVNENGGSAVGVPSPVSEAAAQRPGVAQFIRCRRHGPSHDWHKNREDYGRCESERWPNSRAVTFHEEGRQESGREAKSVWLILPSGAMASKQLG